MELNEKQYLQSLVHVIRAKQRAGGWSDTKELADYIIKEIGGIQVAVFQPTRRRPCAGTTTACKTGKDIG